MVVGLLVFLLLLGSFGDLRSEAQQNSTLDPQEGIYYLFQLIISLFFPVSLFSFWWKWIQWSWYGNACWNLKQWFCLSWEFGLLSLVWVGGRGVHGSYWVGLRVNLRPNLYCSDWIILDPYLIHIQTQPNPIHKLQVGLDQISDFITSEFYTTHQLLITKKKKLIYYQKSEKLGYDTLVLLSI